ncbi:PH domain-containing protein [Paenibacillus popilliae]|uniref:YokE-like PH domain-containing protein n=1 Tax=Paenibacillus popilliae TaxID=78057 RepID=A0ABY3AXY8_PAEPP|nr:PH domain-containing protein [Paenibacillus sp. SDF0028]TQR47139.1 hypothetical protein C7Y44_05810 [Paenibacillus sp. SDF0028]
MRKDFENAISHMNGITKFMNKSSLKEAESYLKDDEQVLNVENVNLDEGPGIFVVTDKRVYFAYKIVASYGFKQILYHDILSVSVDGGISGRLKIETKAHNTLNLNSINVKRVKDVQRNIMERV